MAGEPQDFLGHRVPAAAPPPAFAAGANPLQPYLGSSTPAGLHDLVDAVVARIQAALVGPGPLTWFGTGESPGAGSDPLPYAVLAEPDEQDSYWTTSGDGLAEGHLEVSCYAGTKREARVLGDRVAAQLHDAPLKFSAGTLVYFRQSGRTANLDPDPAPGGGDCWAEIRQFRFMYSF